MYTVGQPMWILGIIVALLVFVVLAIIGCCIKRRRRGAKGVGGAGGKGVINIKNSQLLGGSLKEKVGAEVLFHNNYYLLRSKLAEQNWYSRQPHNTGSDREIVTVQVTYPLN